MIDEGNTRFDAGLMTGIVIGAAIGLLYAPMRGEVLRRHLDTSLRRVRDGVTRRYTEIERDIRQQMDQVQRALDDVNTEFRSTTRRLLGEPAESKDS
jgi:gas vesicle protein